MTFIKKTNSFLKNGKRMIKSHKSDQKVNSIIDFNMEPKLMSLMDVVETKDNLLLHKIIHFKNRKLNNLKNTSTKFKHSLRNSNFAVMWTVSSMAAFILFAGIFLLVPWKVKPILPDKYSIYAAKPLSLKDMNYDVYTKDSRAQRINSVFKEYNCPLEGLGEVFVYEADKYNIPWWLVASISFQESSCGKRTPEVLGAESYNAWGWAVYGDNVQMFDNWVRGIETVSEYMHTRFYSKGITEPCEIMATYTPPSKGSWCEGVNFFGEQIQGYSGVSSY